MKAVIITGGSIEDAFALSYLNVIKPDFLIAADSGLEFCSRAEIRPDHIVGDFDSGREEIVRKFREDGTIPIDTYNPVKDMTDTDIALEKAAALGADEVHFLGATGTRLDHTLSNIFNLRKLRERGIRGVIVDAHNRITMPSGNMVEIGREAQYGTAISLFPFRGIVEGLTLTGFQYPLTEAVLEPGDGGLTVSNRITAETAVVTWKKGILILMETRD